MSIKSRGCARSWPDRDEHVLATLVAHGLSLEAAVERLELETRNVDEAEPLVLRAHQIELVPPSSNSMSILLSPTAYRIVCGTGSS